MAVALLAAVLLPPASASTGIPHSDLHYVYIGATVLAVLVVVACAILGARSCRCSTFSQDVIVVNYFLGVAREVREILAGLGVRRIEDLVGRTEFLERAEGLTVRQNKLP